MGVFCADDGKQFADAVPEDETVDVDVVLDDELEVVVGICEGFFGCGSEDRLGFFHRCRTGRGTEDFPAGGDLARVRAVEAFEVFFSGAADALDAVGIAVENFENREALFPGRKQAGHIESGDECHFRVEADVVLSAECFCIC